MNGSSMGFGMWIFWIVLFVVVFFLAKLAINTESGKGGTSLESPLDILQKRYASGEIDKNEYERKKEELEK